jgi:hypothetical protein
MSRFVVLALLLLACSRLIHAAPDSALALTMEMRETDGRAAVVVYIIRDDGPLAYRIGFTILKPHRSPAEFDIRLSVPSAPTWARWATLMRELWRSATIDPCAGIRFLLLRL